MVFSVALDEVCVVWDPLSEPPDDAVEADPPEPPDDPHAVRASETPAMANAEVRSFGARCLAASVFESRICLTITSGSFGSCGDISLDLCGRDTPFNGSIC